MGQSTWGTFSLRRLRAWRACSSTSRAISHGCFPLNEAGHFAHIPLTTTVKRLFRLCCSVLWSMCVLHAGGRPLSKRFHSVLVALASDTTSSLPLYLFV